MMENIKSKTVFCLKLPIAACLVGMVGINILQVVTRYFVAVTITWAEDITIYALHWIVAFSMPLLWITKEHMIMDIVDMWFSPKALKILNVIIELIGICVGLALAKKSWSAAMVNKGYVLSTLGYDEMWKYIPYVVGGILLAAAAVLNLVDAAAQRRGREAQLDE